MSSELKTRQRRNFFSRRKYSDDAKIAREEKGKQKNIESEREERDIEQHIAALAKQHRYVIGKKCICRLDSQLREIDWQFQEIYKRIVARVEAGDKGTRGEEWLLDNRHVVQEALELVRESLPPVYLKQLPKVPNAKGRPDLRVRALAVALLSNKERPLDIENIRFLVEQYQQYSVLTTGELWALPALLRLALLQHLVEVASDALTLHKPQNKGKMGEYDGVGVASVIIGLRELRTHNWPQFIEQLSHVERTLNDDPAAAYADMEFKTRNTYRGVVEDLARMSGQPEHKVAQYAIELSRTQEAGSRQHHVGFYLVGDGRYQLENALGCRRSLLLRLYQAVTRNAHAVYFAGLTVFLLPILIGLISYLVVSGTPVWLILVIMLVATIPLLGVALALLNGLITHILPPRQLPKLNFETGIPTDFRTVVVMPVLFADVEEVHRILRCIEMNFLNNEDDNLVYAVLSDFADAEEQNCQSDEDFFKAAEESMSALGQRYVDSKGRSPFLLLHRRRCWNDAEACWMGWERKRGKLIEFNRLLKGHEDTSFETCLGDRTILENIRYVITLDADTHMPPGTARRLVGTIAHPLNRVVLDSNSHRAVAGYGFLQPRLEVDPTTSVETVFTELFSGDRSVDLYTHAVSDAYQDLFGEGIFAGKGIYDPQVFDQTLAGFLPENSVLSHDLLEGAFGGAALLSDTIFYEQYPPNIFALLRRSHRWIRGDWQLLPWLLNLVPAPDRAVMPNPLPLIHRWKIADNLRRSLEAPGVLLLFIMAWSGWLPGSAWAWTLGILALTAIPVWVELLSLFWRVVFSPRDMRRYIRNTPALLRQRTLYWLLSLALLPYQAVNSLDAVVRTLYRLGVSRRHLLEWTSAAHINRSLGSGLSTSGTWREMWVSPTLAAVTALGLLVWAPISLLVAAPLLLAWGFAPQIIYKISQPPIIKPPVLSENDRRELRMLGRRTWFFFQQFMGPDDHWLPPDNYQEEPLAVLARRTSPTNIGLGLLSILSAYDFGYLDLTLLSAQLNNSFDRMQSLERYRGHFLNWYETMELRPLQPRYVSTVDSGNLAGSLLTLARGLEDLMTEPLSGRHLVSGIFDTLRVLEETLQSADLASTPVGVREVVGKIHQLHERLEQEVGKSDWWRMIERINEQEVPLLQEHILTVIEREEENFSAEALGRLRQWLDELHHQSVLARRYHDTLEPWQRILASPPSAYSQEVKQEEAAGPVNELLAERYSVLVQALNSRIKLVTLPASCRAAEKVLDELDSSLADAGVTEEQQREARDWNEKLQAALQTARENAKKHSAELRVLAQRARSWVEEMEFGFLYDTNRHLFHIGYNVTAASLDPNYYDLLASESRLAGFVAIAKGDVPARHWLHLERPFRRLHGKVVLMSWSATLFEYLMPRLLMETPNSSLLGQACHNAIEIHRSFTQSLKLPWGISESGYYQFDSHLHYQYRAFGVPGIGFRRDLGDRIVIAPYSSMMALPFDAGSVVDNLRRLREFGGYGQYGLYEAIDFGRSAKAVPRRARTVRSYMSHHQGMIMLALNNFFHADIMLRRFHSDSRIASLTPLLHERIPAAPPALVPWSRPEGIRRFHPEVALESWSAPLRTLRPHYNLLSNGHYSVIQAAEGGGGSYWYNIALTRWQPDPTRHQWGQWCYIRDLDSGEFFSMGLDPCGDDVSTCAAHFAPHRIEYQHHEAELFCRLRIGLSSQHDVEARRLIIKNESGRVRRILVGSYAELVLAPEKEDQRHPAFAKLFVESQYLAEEQVMLYRRRPRSSAEKPVYLGHSVLVQPDVEHKLAWETDRQRFLGRGGSAANPRALDEGLAGFSNTTGAVLDSVIATGQEVVVEPQSEIEIVYLTGVSRSKRELLSMLRSYRSFPQVHWIFALARMQSEHELHNLRIAAGDIHWMMDLLSAVLAPNSSLRAPSRVLARSRHIQPSLWSWGISGDNPILLLQIQNTEETGFAEPILQAHTYWCGRGLAVDLVIIDEDSAGYAQVTRERLQEVVADIRARTLRKLNGSVYIIPGKELRTGERMRLMAAARVILDSSKGAVSAQLGSDTDVRWQLPPFVPVRPADYAPQPTPELKRPDDLLFDNGIGGFSADGREYVMHLKKGQRPPAPWVNVIANPNFGCLMSEAGSSCTWSGNSGEHRLTPWQNDPVRDPSGEVLYLRDEETAEVWSPTPAPRPADEDYQVHHGAGYSEYLHNSHGLEQRWRVFVDREEPVKIGRLTLTNVWERPRRITATYYVEWVLGLTRAATWPHIVSEFESGSEVLLARNAFVPDAKPGVAFLTASLPAHGLTTNRSEFLGRSGDVESPAALFSIGLSGEVECGNDPCAAYQVHMDLPPGATQQVYFILGEGKDRAQALELAERFSQPDQAEAARAEVEQFWEDHLGSVQIETPNKATDLLVNRWLPYQTLACRLWGRSGYYQSSGAFGFRDQLQDVLALLWTRPEWTRAHILKAASRQFQDGDVLHWWHENPLRGVRTRCSDDLLWLPFVTAEYIRSTGDYTILSESVAYLQGLPLGKEENERYAEFEASDEEGSLYEHCCRAIERAGAVGPHGLPVIGNGDWNDGFNRISTTGRGESVWLGWFLVRVCRDMAPLCEHMDDVSLAGHYRELGEDLLKQVEKNGWDGAWYRRAYYDDGTPVGSQQSDECQIDLIAQTWSVMAPEKPVARARQAMESAYRYLVREDSQQILLLAPPFDRTKKDPGYIKGYPPGIRENGGQYTHAATWAVWAAAGLCDSERAVQLFDLLNPILHATDADSVQRYRTEPYVLAGDVYGVPPHVGRGGWTWYSGASGWLYRAAIEALLGLKLHGESLEVRPCLPTSWNQFRVSLRRGQSRYDIEVLNCGGCPETCELTLDGEKVSGPYISLTDDGEHHKVNVTFAASSPHPPESNP